MARRPVDPKIAVAVVYVSANFLSALDTTVINVALPALTRAFDVSTASVEWVVTAYLLSLAAWIPASGWIGDRFGTKRTFLTALALFTVASLACGIAQAYWQLVLFRILQGTGGGMLTPVGVAMLYRVYPPAERARIARLLVLPVVLAPSLGPVLGGFFVDHLSWRWIFLLNLPIGLAALAFGIRHLPEHRQAPDSNLDITGLVLSAAGFTLLVYALHEGAVDGWLHRGTTLPLLAAVVALATFAWRAIRHPEPILRLALLKQRLFRNATTVAVLNYGAFFGVLFLVPLFVQEVRGYSALGSGTATVTEPFGVLAATQIAGRVYPFVGPRRLLFAGGVAVAATCAVLATLDATSSVWLVRVLMFLVGFGQGFSLICLQVATFAATPPADMGHASAVFSTSRQVATALGIATVTTVLTSRLPGGSIARGSVPQQVEAFRAAFAAAALMSIGGAVLALRIRDQDAAASMRRPVGH